MFDRLFRLFFGILGGIFGYVLYEILKEFLDGVVFSSRLTQTDLATFEVLVIIFFVFIFSQIEPLVSWVRKRVASNIKTNLKEVSTTKIVGGTIGIILGLIIAFLLSSIYDGVEMQSSVRILITVTLYIFMSFLGGFIGANKIAPSFEPFEKAAQSVEKRLKENQVVSDLNYDAKAKKNQKTPKILDTSVIIDGRIVDILATGFFEGPIVIPEFVLTELQHISDSSDALKRAKGRRGLDILKIIQDEYGIEIYDTEDEKSVKEIPEVDIKLLKLAQIMKGKVVTNDFNLNKVAKVKGIQVLNINELANAVKPAAIPGEEMIVTLIRQGKDRQQAQGYLPDGTLIVVEEGKSHIGETVEIVVTSALQTAAGRMIFGKLK